MLDDIPKEQWPDVLFSNLVLSLSNAAMMAMGKAPMPGTDKIEKDMDAAQVNIEMLTMLKQKTENNLSENEETLLDTSLSNLRLTYANEINADSKTE